jgi:ferric-dicitrate binding protein FerR (iron transport regulator)
LDQQIVEKFLNDTCTVEEAKKVTAWFLTPEGQRYLAKRLDEDAGLLQDERIKPLLPGVDSKQMWQKIKDSIHAEKKSNTQYDARRYPRRKVASWWYAAAVILIVAAVSVFFVWKLHPVNQIAQNKQPTHFKTGAHEHGSVNLQDGTKIRLNSNSQLWISANYGQKNRKIRLKGEAYFEVHHNAAKPFVIHTHGAVIKDLGTAFDVRAIPGEGNIQVAVKSGKVSIKSSQGSTTQTVKLTGGHFGYLNLETDSIAIDAFGIQNYLSWMNGRIKFDDASLKKVSRQLSRIYSVSFAYSAVSLKRMKLSANFQRGTLKKALAVISLTLSINYRLKNHRVIWSRKN